MNKYYLKYLMNPGLKDETERIFEGIAKGRKRALENWFEDKWLQLEFVKESIIRQLDSDEQIDRKRLIEILSEKRLQFKDFSELFIINGIGDVNISTSKGQVGKNLSTEPYYQKGIKGLQYMHGPYTDPSTLTVGNCNSAFFDEVTLMFALPLINNRTGRNAVLCGRVPNDVMSDVIQEEDTHVYKESGDNYLFMVKNARGIPTGAAISRSRFEDTTFSLGDNLKDGIKTAKWGTVQIRKHTEFEIIFNDPATGTLHDGVALTIKNGSNLEAWPGYPEYRHILVGGMGVLIHPPHSDEVWGMMCEGDIEEIYKFTSLNYKVPMIITGVSALMSGAQLFAMKESLTPMSATFLTLPWLANIVAFSLISRKMMVTPIKKVISVLRNLAEGEGDLTTRLPKNTNDEIGEVARWFNKFLSSQKMTISRAGLVSRTSADSAGSLTAKTENIQKDAPTIAMSVRQIVENLNSQNQVFDRTKGKFQKLFEESEYIDTSIKNINNNMSVTNDNAELSIEASKGVLATMGLLEKEMHNTTTSILTLQNYSVKINEVVVTIDRIAKQTQLLALNASIESARAGEAGRGFGVVAENISALAIECAEATVSISKLIKEVQDETNKATNNIKTIGEKVAEGSDSVSSTINAFTKIQEEITAVSETTMTISGMIASQSQDFLSINKEMEEITTTLRAENATVQGNSENVLNVIEEIFQETHEINELSKILFITSSNLNNIVAGFEIG